MIKNALKTTFCVIAIFAASQVKGMQSMQSMQSLQLPIQPSTEIKHTFVNLAPNLFVRFVHIDDLQSDHLKKDKNWLRYCDILYYSESDSWTDISDEFQRSAKDPIIKEVQQKLFTGHLVNGPDSLSLIANTGVFIKIPFSNPDRIAFAAIASPHSCKYNDSIARLKDAMKNGVETYPEEEILGPNKRKIEEWVKGVEKLYPQEKVKNLRKGLEEKMYETFKKQLEFCNRANDSISAVDLNQKELNRVFESRKTLFSDQQRAVAKKALLEAEKNK